MFRRILRKMLGNRQMIACLLLGLMLAVAMVSSVPMYTNGVLQRMLEKDLENYQVSTNHFPGTYIIDQKTYNLEKKPLDDLSALTAMLQSINTKHRTTSHLFFIITIQIIIVY